MRRAQGHLTRIHVAGPLASGAVIPLPSAAAHHLTRVLRAAVGDSVVVFSGGVEFAASVSRIAKNAVSVKLASGAAIDRESPLACGLAQAISSGERMDVTLQKAVELGVGGIQPLYTERSIVRLDGERALKRLEHWRQVMIAACEQCGRNVVPGLDAPLPVFDWLAALPAASAGEQRILLSPQAAMRLAELPRPQRVLLLAGPEGGFTEAEAECARQRGFTPARLGPRVLRTETAALAALAAMQTLWGDF